MTFGPEPDLEAPYIDAGKREERYQQILEREQDELLEELEDELEIEKFVDDNLADPNKLLVQILHRVIMARKELLELKRNARKKIQCGACYSTGQDMLRAKGTRQDCRACDGLGYKYVAVPEVQQAKDKLLKQFNDSVESDFMEHVERVSERRAQRIYDSE